MDQKEPISPETGGESAHPGEDQAENKQQKKKKRKEERRRKRELEQKRKKQAKTTRKIINWLIILIIVVVGVFVLIRLTGGGDGTGEVLAPDEIAETEWIKGNPDAEVTLLEYGDFQCPACAAYYPVLKELEDKYGSDVKFVFRHFPLRPIHRNAEAASRAAEAAGAQGKFFEMHDVLFERQDDWARENDAAEIFARYAEEIGLDVARYSDDVVSDLIANLVQDDVNSGRSSRVRGTPSFFLNGELLPNPTFEEFEQIIVAAIDETSGSDVQPVEEEKVIDENDENASSENNS